MPSYFLRLDQRENYEQLIHQHIGESSRFTKILCVKHKGIKTSNNHWHMTLITDYKTQALRVELKKYFTLGKGNGHMSLKTWDGDIKANSYMFHERDVEVIINKGYTEKQIEEFKTKNEVIQAEIAGNTPAEMCRQVFSKLIKQYPINYDGGILAPQTICYAIWDYYKTKGTWQPNKFQMERYIKQIQQDYAEYFDKGTGSSANWLKTKEHWFREMFPQRNNF